MNLNERIAELENQVRILSAKVIDLSTNTEEKLKTPYTIAGGISEKGSNTPIDIKCGRSHRLGGHVIWNNTEIEAPINKEPSLPTKGYNKHSHSRYSGGALIKDEIEIVEYVWGTITNKHSQEFWKIQPKIATEINTKKEKVEKIGKLELVFNPDTKKWGSTTYEIDIKKCNLVERDNNGNIVHSAPLYNEDKTKTCIIWDEIGKCWRFYATYAPGE
jgi:hypothetical protein